MTRPKLEYERKKVRRGMLLAPLIGSLGMLPYFFQLNLGAGGTLGLAVAVVLAAYLAALIFGTPGYLVLRSLGLCKTPYLIAYAAAIVVLAAVVLGDVYAAVFFGPPFLIGAIAFCVMRGPALGTAPASE